MRFCSACLNQLIPSFRFLPSFPNIALGGYLFDYSDPFKMTISDVKFHSNLKLADWLKRLDYFNNVPDIYLDVDVCVCVPAAPASPLRVSTDILSEAALPGSFHAAYLHILAAPVRFFPSCKIDLVCKVIILDLAPLGECLG